MMTSSCKKVCSARRSKAECRHEDKRMQHIIAYRQRNRKATGLFLAQRVCHLQTTQTQHRIHGGEQRRRDRND